jgi:hypothetical protein
MTLKPFLATAAAIGLLAGCADPMTGDLDRTRTGLLTGALAGAALGAATGRGPDRANAGGRSLWCDRGWRDRVCP